MSKRKPKERPGKSEPLSLDPVPFSEAVGDLLRVKPEKHSDPLPKEEGLVCPVCNKEVPDPAETYCPYCGAPLGPEEE